MIEFNTILLYFLGFLLAVFVYMVLGATFLELFLFFIRKNKKNKFIRFLISKALIEKQIDHPNFEMILWCTIFWPLLVLFYIIIIPTIGFTYIIEVIFNKFEDRLDFEEAEDKDSEEDKKE